MLVNDARGNPVTASGPLPVALLDDAVEAYLGFRKDTGDRLKAALTAEPDCALAHCLRGYFMMLFGQRVMVSRAQRSLKTALATARATGVTPREAAHVAALAAWVEGDFAGTTARWEAIAAEHPRDILALKLGQYGRFYSGESERMRDVLAGALPSWDAGVPGYGLSSAATPSVWKKPAITPRRSAPVARQSIAIPPTSGPRTPSRTSSR